MTTPYQSGEKRLRNAEKQIIKLENELRKEGESIDPLIRETVVIFNAFGLYTRTSCEGHLDITRGISSPHIDVIPFQQDTWWKLWEREGKANRQRNEFLKKNNKPVTEYTKREKDFLKRNWKEKHILDRPMAQLNFRLMNLLEDFYRNRKVAVDARLTLWDPLGRQIMVIPQGGRVYRFRPAKDRLRYLKRYQKELFDFAAFIKTLVLKGKTLRDINL